jgi:hypothetical protein
MSSTQFPPTPTSYPLSFDTVPHFFALSEKLSTLESGDSALFRQNTGVWGTLQSSPDSLAALGRPSIFIHFVFSTIRIPLPANRLFFTSIQNPGGVGAARRMSTPNRQSPYLAITYIQPLHFQGITHSFAQRRQAIPPIFNGLRTLSIATGVYSPGRPLAATVPVSIPKRDAVQQTDISRFPTLFPSEEVTATTHRPLTTVNTCGALHLSGYRVLDGCLLECLILVATRST